jgi:8-oxo-dGTP pyrophosphatase MutT (NUDIX family)
VEFTPDHIRSFLSSQRRRKLEDASLRRAAVLLLLYSKDDLLHVLFTKRTSIVEHHKGQISFPGGSADDGDGSIIDTALRETKEEVGLDTTQIEILGLYHDQWTPTGFSITPVIGYLSSLPELTLNHHEVEEIIEIPVSFFLSPGNEQIRLVERFGKKLEVYYYNYGQHQVWGATAAILRSFLTDISKAIIPPDPRTGGDSKNPLQIT